MENDFRTPDQFPPDRNLPPHRTEAPNTGLWLVAGMIAAIALVALFAFRGNGVDMPTNGPATAAYDSSSGAANDIEPAEGNQAVATTHSPAVVPNDAPEAVAPVETTNPVEPTDSLHTYASEEECAAATDKACHYVTCDSIPAGKQPDEVCGPSFQKGWQSIVPAPDKTAVPEEIAPPLTGQGKAPVEKPALTGQ